MCGIAGLVVRDGSPERSALVRAAEQLAHRGPDDSGIEIMDGVGLAHTRLSIIDLAGGHQPIRDVNGDYVLVANGEIYNFVELMAEARADGYRFTTQSDSETILYAWERFGVDGLRRLNGMFAFALYCVRERTLILARDRLGIKPLYVASLPDRIAFASEIKGLLPLLPQMPGISAAALARTLEIGFSSGPETLFEGIRRLDSGTAMIIRADLSVTSVPYWHPLSIAPRNDVTATDAQEMLSSLFAQILREHVRSDVPYGLFLSGGVDSATLLWRLSEQSAGTLSTYSVGYRDAGSGDELAQAARVARHFGSAHTELRLDTRSVLNALPFSVWAADDLVYDPACLPTALLAQAAARDLKVVFTGEGGDEVFGGYGRYRRTGIQRWLKRLQSAGNNGYRDATRWPKGLRHACFGPELKIPRRDLDAPVQSAWRQTPARWGFVRQAQYTDLRTELCDDLLVKVDRMLMGFGLEGRVPFLDHRLVEFGLSLPQRIKVRGRVGKVLLRDWARDSLPAGHTEGRKRGFGVPVGGLFRGAFLSEIEQRLQVNPILRTWLKPGAVAAVTGELRRTGRGDDHLLQLLQLAAWYRVFLDGPVKRPAVDDDLLGWI